MVDIKLCITLKEVNYKQNYCKRIIHKQLIIVGFVASPKSGTQTPERL